jgi:predicted transposase YdaD
MENNNDVLKTIHTIEAQLREYVPIVHKQNEETLKYFIDNGMESPDAKSLEELSNKCKNLIVERYRLYKTINLIPKYNLPKDMLLDELDEKQKNDSEFIVIMPTPEDLLEESRTVKPWDFLNPNTEYADEATSQERYSICKGCPEFINLSKQCKKCGCFMSAKTRLADATCPIGKW